MKTIKKGQHWRRTLEHSPACPAGQLAEIVKIRNGMVFYSIDCNSLANRTIHFFKESFEFVSEPGLKVGQVWEKTSGEYGIPIGTQVTINEITLHSVYLDEVEGYKVSPRDQFLDRYTLVSQPEAAEIGQNLFEHPVIGQTWEATIASHGVNVGDKITLTTVNPETNSKDPLDAPRVFFHALSSGTCNQTVAGLHSNWKLTEPSEIAEKPKEITQEPEQILPKVGEIWVKTTNAGLTSVNRKVTIRRVSEHLVKHSCSSPRGTNIRFFLKNYKKNQQFYCTDSKTIMLNKPINGYALDVDIPHTVKGNPVPGILCSIVTAEGDYRAPEPSEYWGWSFTEGSFKIPSSQFAEESEPVMEETPEATDKVADLQIKIEDLKSKLDASRRVNDIASAEKQKLDRQLKVERENNASYQRKIKDMQRINDFDREASSANYKLWQGEKKLREELTENLKESEQKREHHWEQFQNIDAKNTKSENKIKVLEKQSKDDFQSMLKLQDELAQVKLNESDNYEETKRLTEKLQIAEENVAKAEQTMEKLRHLQDKSTENEKLTLQLIIVKSDCEYYSKQSKNKTETINKLTQENADLKEDLDKSSKPYNDVADNYVQSDSECFALNRQINDKTAKIEGLETTLNVVKGDLQKSDKFVVSLRTELLGSEKKREELSEVIANFGITQQDNNKLVIENQKLKDLRTDYYRILSNWQNKYLAIENRNKDLIEEMEVVRKSTARLLSQNETKSWWNKPWFYESKV